MENPLLGPAAAECLGFLLCYGSTVNLLYVEKSFCDYQIGSLFPSSKKKIFAAVNS